MGYNRLVNIGGVGFSSNPFYNDFPDNPTLKSMENEKQ